MNKENKNRIKKLEWEYLKIKHPMVPEHCLAKTAWSDQTANGLTKMIVSFIQMSGYQAERINTMGTYRAAKKYTNLDGVTRTIGKGSYTKSGSTPGSADISATINGRSVKIEIKIGADRQSDAQKAYEKAIVQAGGLYLICKNFDDFIDWFDALMKK
jgi:hypothetical protein